MSRTPKNAAILNNTTTSLVALDYTVPVNTVAAPSLVVTNNSSSINYIEIYITSDGVDYIIASKNLPGGSGKSWRVLELSDQKLNAGHKISVKQSDSSSVNYFLSVSEIGVN